MVTPAPRRGGIAFSRLLIYISYRMPMRHTAYLWGLVKFHTGGDSPRAHYGAEQMKFLRRRLTVFSRVYFFGGADDGRTRRSRVQKVSSRVALRNFRRAWQSRVQKVSSRVANAFDELRGTEFRRVLRALRKRSTNSGELSSEGFFAYAFYAHTYREEIFRVLGARYSPDEKR